MKDIQSVKTQIEGALQCIHAGSTEAAIDALNQALKVLSEFPDCIEVIAYVEGGNVQGARSNYERVGFGVFDIDNIEAERAGLANGSLVADTQRREIVANHQNEEIWNELIKEYRFAIY